MRSSRLALWRISVACGLALTVTQARGAPDGDPLRSDPPLLHDVLGLSGSVRTDEFSKDKSFSDRTGYAVGSVWVTATPHEFWGVKTYFDGRAQDQDLARSSGTSWELREGYARISA